MSRRHRLNGDAGIRKRSPYVWELRRPPFFYNPLLRAFLFQIDHRLAHGFADQHVGLGVAVVVKALVAG